MTTLYSLRYNHEKASLEAIQEFKKLLADLAVEQEKRQEHFQALVPLKRELDDSIDKLWSSTHRVLEDLHEAHDKKCKLVMDEFQHQRVELINKYYKTTQSLNSLSAVPIHLGTAKEPS